MSAVLIVFVNIIFHGGMMPTGGRIMVRVAFGASLRCVLLLLPLLLPPLPHTPLTDGLSWDSCDVPTVNKDALGLSACHGGQIPRLQGHTFRKQWSGPTSLLSLSLRLSRFLPTQSFVITTIPSKETHSKEDHHEQLRLERIPKITTPYKGCPK